MSANFTSDERRSRRSNDPIRALHLQLATVRLEAELDAVVLVDDRGLLVAGAGAWPVCEELAAFAPLLDDPARITRKTVQSHLAELPYEVVSMSFGLDGTPVILCGRGGNQTRGDALGRAALGVQRILRAA